MNVSTIVVPQDQAEAKYEKYRKLPATQKTESDHVLQKVWKAAKAGSPIIDVATAFKETGLNELGQPKLAIARASWPTVYAYPGRGFSATSGYWVRGGFAFSCEPRWFTGDAYVRDYALPSGTFAEDLLTKKNLVSKVPHMPPDVRPKNNFNLYHILFEVDKWDEHYPVDPYLLRRVAGDLFVVLAEWELTKLEASILGSIRIGN